MAATKLNDMGQLLGRLENGDLSEDFMVELRKVNSALQTAAGAKGKAKGQIVITLDIEVEGDTWHAEAAIKSKVPKVPRRKSFLFVTDDGSLSLEHPRQHDMFPRPVSRDSAAG